MLRAEVTQPDVVVVLDPGLLSIINVTSGLKDDGIIIVNTKKTAKQIRDAFGIKGRVAVIDATEIAREVLGVPIVNTTMLGALVKATQVVGQESLKEPITKRFGRLAERNIKAMERAHQKTLVEEQG